MNKCKYCGKPSKVGCCSDCNAKIHLVRRIKAIGDELLQMREKDRRTNFLRKYGKTWKGDD